MAANLGRFGPNRRSPIPDNPAPGLWNARYAAGAVGFDPLGPLGQLALQVKVRPAAFGRAILFRRAAGRHTKFATAAGAFRHVLLTTCTLPREPDFAFRPAFEHLMVNLAGDDIAAAIATAAGPRDGFGPACPNFCALAPERQEVCFHLTHGTRLRSCTNTIHNQRRNFLTASIPARHQRRRRARRHSVGAAVSTPGRGW